MKMVGNTVWKSDLFYYLGTDLKTPNKLFMYPTQIVIIVIQIVAFIATSFMIYFNAYLSESAKNQATRMIYRK